MNDSILDSTKKALGIASDYHDFDLDIIMLINSTFSTLEQIGIGPARGFMIEDATTTWDALLQGDKRLNSVKTYVTLKVRVLFDPPSVASVLTAMQAQIEQMEWRLNVAREYQKAVPDSINDSTQPDGILDGGNPSGVIVTSVQTIVYDGGSP